MTEVTNEKARIVIPTEKYTKCKTAAGGASHHNGDPVATALSGALLSQVYVITALMLNAEVSELEAKYQHLNAGQQRMNLGNRIRGAVNAVDTAMEKAVAKNDKIAIANAAIDATNVEIEAHNAEVEKSGKGGSKVLKEHKPLVDLPNADETGAEKLKRLTAPIREEIEIRLVEEQDAKDAADKAAKKKAKAEAAE